ncbi:DUF5634 family protein [Sediminibacillus massiliensis]|uniref:DUF5634 family protein n=1 Tax=Sediminibacillus massiliensis TaxID=1926277 RepID=UPI00098864E3|nr:DUF5634 family protein [Sediminibacillus massiliensis]
MDEISLDQIADDLRDSFRPLAEKYNLDDIGLFEEEGQDNAYHIGYAIKKDGRVFMVYLPFIQGEEGYLTLAKQEWTVQTENPTDDDLKGFANIEDVLQKLFA